MSNYNYDINNNAYYNKIKEGIKINTEYAKLVPALTLQEYISLKNSIKEIQGNIIPIIVNQDNIVVDGHHRFRACQELRITPKIETKEFADGLEEKEFIISINRNRRQLNQFQVSELGYKLEEIEKKKARNRQLKFLKNVGDNNSYSISSLASNDANDKEEKEDKGKVSKIIANKIGQSSTKYERNKRIIEEGTEKQKNKLREGKEATNKIYNEIIKAKKKEELLLKNSKVSSSLEIATDVSNNNKPFELILGDLIEKGKEIPEESIDLIFTDPPYSTEYIPVYSELSILAKRVLKPGGSIVTYIGQHNLPEILNIFTSNHLKYWWPIAVKHTGATKAFHQRKVFVLWKPLLWFVKGEKLSTSYPIAALNDYLYDYVDSRPPEKLLHPWEQSTVEAIHVIKKLTIENQTVMDPLMGSGTTGIAALNLDRQFIGIEKDHEKFLIATNRIAEFANRKIRVSDFSTKTDSAKKTVKKGKEDNNVI